MNLNEAKKFIVHCEIFIPVNQEDKFNGPLKEDKSPAFYDPRITELCFATAALAVAHLPEDLVLPL